MSVPHAVTRYLCKRLCA